MRKERSRWLRWLVAAFVVFVMIMVYAPDRASAGAEMPTPTFVPSTLAPTEPPSSMAKPQSTEPVEVGPTATILPLPLDPLLVRVVDMAHPVDEMFVAGVRPGLVLVEPYCRNLYPGERDVSIWNTNTRANGLAVTDLCRLLRESLNQGLRLTLRSGFRDLGDQEEALKKVGGDTTRVLPAGYSQHQTGLAFDLTSPSVGNELVKEFAGTKEYQFLIVKAREFGFVESYVANHDGVMGEPWHWVYLGPELAKKYEEMRAVGLVKDPFEFQALYGP